MTDSFAEPASVGPSAGGNLRASDADREHVVTLLSAAYAEGRLSRDEHDQRLDQVMVAKTFDDLIPVTQDLVPLAHATSVPSATASRSYTVDTTSASPPPERMIAVFGAVNRKGVWRVRKSTQALALFGGMDLDMREAVFESPVVEITGLWCFGGLDIKVPAGIEVRDQTVGIFGGTDVGDLGVRQPGGPVLVIKGLALFGGVSIKGPKQPKGERR